MVLGAYQPDVQCRGNFGRWDSCRDIIDDMPTLTATETFGLAKDPTVQVSLPRYVEASQWGLFLAVAGLTLMIDMHR